MEGEGHEERAQDAQSAARTHMVVQGLGGHGPGPVGPRACPPAVASSSNACARAEGPEGTPAARHRRHPSPIPSAARLPHAPHGVWFSTQPEETKGASQGRAGELAGECPQSWREALLGRWRPWSAKREMQRLASFSKCTESKNRSLREVAAPHVAADLLCSGGGQWRLPLASWLAPPAARPPWACPRISVPLREWGTPRCGQQSAHRGVFGSHMHRHVSCTGPDLPPALPQAPARSPAGPGLSPAVPPAVHTPPRLLGLPAAGRGALAAPPPRRRPAGPLRAGGGSGGDVGAAGAQAAPCRGRW